MKLRALLLSTVFLVPACSSAPDVSAPADAAASDASSPTDAASRIDASDASPPAADAPDDAPLTCNALVNSAPTITVEQVASDPPSPQGGTVADGTYAMTAAVIYTGAAGPSGPSGTAQTTLQISGSTIQVANAGQPATRTVTFTISGTGIDSVDTCPDTDERPATYTATPTSLVVELAAGTDDAGARTLVETFTKQ
jgi:hypothetical protein